MDLWISRSEHVMNLIALRCIYSHWNLKGWLVWAKKEKNSLQVDEDGEASSTLSWACIFLVQQTPLIKHGENEISRALPRRSTTRFSPCRREKWSLRDSRWPSLSLGQLGGEAGSQSWPQPSPEVFAESLWHQQSPASGFRPLQCGKGHVCASHRADSATQLQLTLMEDNF